jgi:hypothetical protein
MSYALTSMPRPLSSRQHPLISRLEPCNHRRRQRQTVEWHFRRVMARLCAGQHGHAAGFAVALDDGQALVLG